MKPNRKKWNESRKRESQKWFDEFKDVSEEFVQKILTSLREGIDKAILDDINKKEQLTIKIPQTTERGPNGN